MGVPPIVLAAITAVSLSLLIAVMTLLARPDPARLRAVRNLELGMRKDAAARTAEEEGIGALGILARRLAPAGTIRRLDRLLARAGRPAAWPVHRVLTSKLVLGVTAVVLAALYARSVPGMLAVGLGIVATGVAYFIPELLLHSRGQERSQRIGLELADTLDQMTIAVEAGLGFDSAMARAGKNGKGPLAEELVRTLQDIQIGQSRREAYEALGKRTDVPDLRRFIRAVIQADMYGIAVADVLRTQASEMRLKRRQRAEEKAMQIPVKVIFPLMLCILPVLFIVLLGPAAMDIAKAFG